MADIAIIVILVIFLIIGIAKGFLKQVLGLVGTVLALILAFSFCKQLADVIITNTSLKAAIAPGIAEFLGLPETLVDAETATETLRQANIPEFMIASISEYIAQLNESTVNLSKIVSEAIAGYIIVFLSFVAIFIGVKLVSLILKGFSKLLTKIQVIKFVDRLLGSVLGLVKGLLVVYTLLYLIDIMTFSFMEVVHEAVNASYIADFLSNYNPFILFLAPILTSIGV